MSGEGGAATGTDPGPLLETLAAIWHHARADTVDLPSVRFAISTSGPLVLHHQTRWTTVDGTPPALIVDASTLRAGPPETLQWVLHEAAHLLCWHRGVKDTTTRGVYHNKLYLMAAEEVGLEWPTGARPVPGRGYSSPRLAGTTRERYEGELGTLAEILPRMLPHLDVGKADRPQQPGRVNFQCQCPEPRKIRVAATVAARGPILCGVCKEEFTAPE